MKPTRTHLTARWTRSGAILASTVAAALLLAAPATRACALHSEESLATPAETLVGSDDAVVIIDQNRIYYPGAVRSSDVFRKPGAVNSGIVYASIPEYREIKEKNLEKEKNAEYWLLLKKATDRFLNGVKQAALALGLDIVGETGALAMGDGPVNDVTHQVIQNLS